MFCKLEIFAEFCFGVKKFKSKKIVMLNRLEQLFHSEKEI